MQRRGNYKATTYKARAIAPRPSLSRARSLPINRIPFSSYQPRRQEKKNIDTTSTTTIVAAQTVGNPLVLNSVAQGTTPNTYLGRSLTMKSLLIRWAGYLDATTTGSSGLRMIVVYDKQTNGAIPVTTDVFQVDQMTSPMNLNNNRRFEVVLDEMIPCVGTGGPQAWFVERYVKMNRRTEFSGAGAGVTQIATGSLVAYFYQQGGLLVASPINSFYSRVRFVDE